MGGVGSSWDLSCTVTELLYVRSSVYPSPVLHYILCVDPLWSPIGCTGAGTGYKQEAPEQAGEQEA